MRLADATNLGSPLLDAGYVPRGTPSFDAPGHNAHAQLLVKKACKHGKARAASDDGVLLIDQAAASAATHNGAFKAPE